MTIAAGIELNLPRHGGKGSILQPLRQNCGSLKKTAQPLDWAKASVSSYGVCRISLLSQEQNARLPDVPEQAEKLGQRFGTLFDLSQGDRFAVGKLLLTAPDGTPLTEDESHRMALYGKVSQMHIPSVFGQRCSALHQE